MALKSCVKWPGLCLMKSTTCAIRSEVSSGKRLSFCFHAKCTTYFCPPPSQMQCNLPSGLHTFMHNHAMSCIPIFGLHHCSTTCSPRVARESTLWLMKKVCSVKTTSKRRWVPFPKFGVMILLAQNPEKAAKANQRRAAVRLVHRTSTRSSK